VGALASVHVAIEDAIGVIRVDRAPVNQLGNDVLDELIDAIVGLGARSEVRVVVVTGTGSKAFLAGADLEEFATMRLSEVAVAHHVARTHRLLDEIARCRVPVIAAVQAHAVGGGFEVALACDLVVVDEDAKLGCPEVKLGLIPGAGGTQRLTALVGRLRSAEVILTGRLIGAQEAAAMGLVTKVAASGETVNAALRLGRDIAGRPAVAVQCAKRAIRASESAALPSGLEQERREFLSVLRSRDAAEGIGAFLDKREPAFTHQ